MKSMKDVPNVEFRAPNIQKSGVEVLDLDIFYKKLSQCKFDPSKPHRINYFCFIYITQGQGGHFIDFQYHTFQKGSFIFVNKNQVHAFDLKSRPQGKMINVTEAFFDSILTNIRIPLFTPTHLVTSYQPVITLSDSLTETCDALLLEIDRAQTPTKSDPLLIQLLFSSLLVALARERKSNTEHLSETQAMRFNQFLLSIEEKFTQTREASVYADMLHISYKSLNQLCKLACDQTAKQLIDAHTILEIKRRLIIDNSQVQEIAFELGFDDVPYFVRFFKRHTLVTPSQFKEYSKAK
ncbi:helix-turn-helix transcriptional regulator [uncultured Shewanella sp.]|uniref:AraC family transcriptional regulator n=1 Tax=Shewanella atlantica TaxID=271099 RepID=UPI0026159EAD|nr:helix-turn-helix transcriptional regulator [uncultured Shewanella sp.]